VGLWQPAEAVVEEARQIGYKRVRLDTAMEPAKCVYTSLGSWEILPYQRTADQKRCVRGVDSVEAGWKSFRSN
jgi:hypothetical protein